ncbi:MAG: BlaI/MecI/CopY family transcriptional regulator [Bacteroidota bacterium]
MQKLTKKEEQIMHVLWRLEKAFVKEIIAELPEPKPHYNTVSTIVRILSDKGFIGHESFGNTHRYHPIIAKKDYQKSDLGDVLHKYFDNSWQKMVAYFAKEEKIGEEEIEEVIKLIKKGK